MKKFTRDVITRDNLAELEDLPAKSSASADLKAAVSEARSMVPEFEYTGQSAQEIKREILARLHPSITFGDDKSNDYVNAFWREDLKTGRRTDKAEEVKKEAAEPVADRSARTARAQPVIDPKAHINRQVSDAWKRPGNAASAPQAPTVADGRAAINERLSNAWRR